MEHFYLTAFPPLKLLRAIEYYIDNAEKVNQLFTKFSSSAKDNLQSKIAH